jgi:hypothetical protein
VKGAIKCFVSKAHGSVKWIKMESDGYWKVITARAVGDTKRFGNTFIGRIDEVHSGSFLSFKVKSKREALSLLSYLRCELPQLMLRLRLNSHNLAKNVLKWVPLPVLDREWDDEQINKLYKL